MARQSHILQSDKKAAFRLLIDLYSTDNTFRNFCEFAVIGAVVLFFIHGYQSVSVIGNAARSAVTSPSYRARPPGRKPTSSSSRAATAT